MSGKFIAYGRSFSGDYNTELEAREVCRKNHDGEVYIKLSDVRAQHEQLLAVVGRIVLKARGRSGGSVYMILRDDFLELKDVAKL